MNKVNRGISVAILGASGLVGRVLVRLLEERKFPVSRLVPLGSERSAGTSLTFHGNQVPIRLATPKAFDGIDLVLSSAGGQVSRELLPEATLRGAIAIDNTSAFRMDADVPLVVPEVNGHRLAQPPARGIIANPNCSTIQLVVALQPLHQAADIERVVVATYQSVSGAGRRGIDRLMGELAEPDSPSDTSSGPFSHPIAFNAIPQIDHFLDDGATREEWKMQVETPKILEADVAVHATCVRVPVVCAHSEAVWIQTRKPLDPAAARELLGRAPGVRLMDDPSIGAYPTAIDAGDQDDVLVGRIRRDPSVANGLALWVVADNLRKGAALNAVQIAEVLVGSWLRPT